MLFYVLSGNRMSQIVRRILENSGRLGSVLSGPVYRRAACRLFCAGSRIEDALAKAAEYAARGQHSILEFIPKPFRDEASREESYEQAAWEIKRVVESAARSNGDAAFVLVRPSTIANLDILASHQRQPGKIARFPNRQEHAQYEAAWNRFDSIAQAARQRRVFLLLGAVEVRAQTAVDDISLRLMRAYNQKAPVVLDTVQLYRADRMRFLQILKEAALRDGFYAGVNLVRGDYILDEEIRARRAGAPLPPVLARPEDLKRNYRRAANYCIDGLSRFMICFSSHDPDACTRFIGVMRAQGVAAGDPRICFAQFMGIGDHIASALVDGGYNVLRVVPYGSAQGALPFSLRRLRQAGTESPEAWRESRIISRELARRRRERITRFKLRP